jgi:DNA-binding Lrp family transcriptional regulator
MLHQFLQIVQAEKVESLLEIARSLKISPDMALRIAKDLTTKGYLQEIRPDCDEHQEVCSDCPSSQGCQVLTRHWFLTEKGKKVVSRV